MSVEFPLYSFLIIYIVYIGIFLIFTFFNIQHLTRHGFASAIVYVMVVVYLILAALIILSTYYYLREVDWSQVVPLFSENYKDIKF